MSARIDYQVGGEAGYTGADVWGVMPGDVRDSGQMQPFNPAPQRPWWESLALYGVTRAIDNRFAPPTVSGNVQGGSFAGQNGRTYGNTPNNAAGQPAQGAGGIDGGMLILLAGAALAAFIAFG